VQHQVIARRSSVRVDDKPARILTKPLQIRLVIVNNYSQSMYAAM
jgi:hypothetical protein